ncbi:MAG TPA: NusG domain II-containing protein [bacterium]|nr:NusG domain II-containing protein [bacterium]
MRRRSLLGMPDAGVLLLALTGVVLAWLLIPPTGSARAVGRVRVQTAIAEYTYLLQPDREVELELPGGGMRLQFAHGSVRVAESNCPRGLCRAHGWLGGPDDAIVCVPRQVAITRIGGEQCDAVTR